MNKPQMNADKLAEWFVKWKIAFNVEKSEALLFHGRRRYRPEENNIMDGFNISYKKVKYLEAFIIFKEHCQKFRRKSITVRKKLYLLA